MNRIELNGSHYEIGLKMGEILKKQAEYPPEYSAAVLEKSRAYEEQVKIYAPDLLDEFRDIADSMGIDYSNHLGSQPLSIPNVILFCNGCIRRAYQERFADSGTEPRMDGGR